MTILSGIAADEGSFCTGLEVGLPLAEALALALAAAFGVAVELPLGAAGEPDAGTETVGKTTLGDAVVVAGPREREINTPRTTAAPTSTTTPAMIKISRRREPPDPCPSPGPGG
jgi:hypothetical protein